MVRSLAWILAFLGAAPLLADEVQFVEPAELGFRLQPARIEEGRKIVILEDSTQSSVLRIAYGPMGRIESEETRTAGGVLLSRFQTLGSEVRDERFAPNHVLTVSRPALGGGYELE